MAKRILEGHCYEAEAGEVYCLDGETGRLSAKPELRHALAIAHFHLTFVLDDQGRVTSQGKVVSSDGKRALVDRPTPTLVPGLDDVVELSWPGDFLARHRDGTVSYFRSVARKDTAGTEGIAREWYDETKPRRLRGVKDAIDLDGMFILTAEGEVLRWMDPFQGRGESLGRVPGAVSISSYPDGSVFVATSNGHAFCQAFGEAGASDRGGKPRREWLQLPEFVDVVALGRYDYALTGLTRSGEVWWRRPQSCGPSRPVRAVRLAAISNVTMMGGAPLCFLQKDHQVACVGGFGKRRLGSGSGLADMVVERMRLGVPLGEPLNQ